MKRSGVVTAVLVFGRPLKNIGRNSCTPSMKTSNEPLVAPFGVFRFKAFRGVSSFFSERRAACPRSVFANSKKKASSSPDKSKGCVSKYSKGADSERIHRSEEHTSELQSLRHLVC